MPFSALFQLKTFDTFWLSNTPFEVSKHPDTKNFRICTTAQFSTPAGDLTVLATHWDQTSDSARALSASLILQRAQYEVEQSSRPILLFGDFNSVTSTVQGESTGYQIITGESDPVAINSTFQAKYPTTSNATFNFVNLRQATPATRRSGNFATFTGFGSSYNETFVNASSSQIDFLFGGSNGGW